MGRARSAQRINKQKNHSHFSSNPNPLPVAKPLAIVSSSATTMCSLVHMFALVVLRRLCVDGGTAFLVRDRSPMRGFLPNTSAEFYDGLDIHTQTHIN